MVFVRRISALLLLALWLPATLHCALENAGLDEVFRCAESHKADADGEHADVCTLIETACYKSGTEIATLPAPRLGAVPLIFLFPPPLLSQLPPWQGIGEEETAPLEVARTWQFVVRAAPPARAPSPAA